MSDPIAQLKNLKSNPNAGWASDVEKNTGRRMLMEAIGGDEPVVVQTTVPAYTRWVFADFISKPLAASVAIFVLLLGGGMTTVNAAYNSLPGDTLYQVKMVTEAAQLKLASSEKKAILHTEFAERRLDEAVTLSEGSASEEIVRIAMDAFQIEIALAKGAVRDMQDEGHKETVAVAYEVGQKIDALTDTLGNQNAEEGLNIDAEGAEEATREASDAVVDVMVETHEAAGTDQTAISLESRFREGVIDIQSRQTYDLGRVAVVKSALTEEIALAAGIENSYVQSVEFTIAHSTDRLPEAMDLMANGGVRAAFDILVNINQSLANGEANITEMEIQISVASWEATEDTDIPTEDTDLFDDDDTIINSREDEI